MPKEVDAITKLYDFLLWIVPKLEKFPRSQKFLIADRIETVLLGSPGLTPVLTFWSTDKPSLPGLVAAMRTSG